MVNIAGNPPRVCFAAVLCDVTAAACASAAPTRSRRPPLVTVAVAVAAALAGWPVSMAEARATVATGPELVVHADRPDRHPISPLIYGMNLANPQLAAELRLPVDRWGGNQATRYNYLTNTTNSGSDWYFLSHRKSESADDFVNTDRAVVVPKSESKHGHSATVMTVPIIGRVTKPIGPRGENQCSFSIAKYGPQMRIEPSHPDCGNGVRTDGREITGNDPDDTSQPAEPSFVHGWVRHFVEKYGDAAHGGVPIYELDNEPSSWSKTHRDIHPRPLSYDELWNRTRDYAEAVKRADPTAATIGPSDWGWCAYFYAPVDDPVNACAPGPDQQAHGGVPLAKWYLQQARAHEERTGVRLLDYFDEHYYPTDVALTGAGDAARQKRRLRSTRSLWDPNYVDEGWIGQATGEAVKLIPRMRSWIASSYPNGTPKRPKLAISEYNFGGLESINGALAQADVLGIFARERVELATLWGPPRLDQPGAFAFRVYRNYDGKGGRFGETWIRSTSKDQGKVALYAAARRDGALTAVAINKTGDELRSRLRVAGVPAGAKGTAQVWRYSAKDLAAIVREPDMPLKGSSVSVTLPASSLTMLVLK